MRKLYLYPIPFPDMPANVFKYTCDAGLFWCLQLSVFSLSEYHVSKLFAQFIYSICIMFPSKVLWSEIYVTFAAWRLDSCACQQLQNCFGKTFRIFVACILVKIIFLSFCMNLFRFTVSCCFSNQVIFAVFIFSIGHYQETRLVSISCLHLLLSITITNGRQEGIIVDFDGFHGWVSLF